MKKILLFCTAVLLTAVILCSCGNSGSIEVVGSFPDETSGSEDSAVTQTDEIVSESTESVSETVSDKIPAQTAPPEGSMYLPNVLMYHLILEEPYSDYTDLFVRPEDFEGQIKDLAESGYTFLFADEYRRTDVPTVMITLDDGYLDNYTEAFPILKKYNAKATVFMITDAIDHAEYLSAEQMKEMADSGLVRFGSHTDHHLEVASLDEESMRREFEDSIGKIKEITGQNSVDALCYPSGSYNELAMSVASEYFRFAYTTESPYSTSDFTDFNIPRYRIKRSLGPCVTSLFG